MEVIGACKLDSARERERDTRKPPREFPCVLHAVEGVVGNVAEWLGTVVQTHRPHPPHPGSRDAVQHVRSQRRYASTWRT